MEKNKREYWLFQVIFNKRKCDKALALLGKKLILKIEDIYKWMLIGYGIYFFITLLQLTVLFFISQGGEVYYKPFWWVIPTVLLIIHVVMLIVLWRTHKTIEGLKKKYKNAGDTYEKDMKSFKKITKFKPGFYYALHKVEKYVEDMELKGFRLCGKKSMEPMITFREDEPRLVKCCVDVQRKVNSGYFELYKEDGWELREKLDNLVYITMIWVKEYEEGQKVPYIYSESVLKYKNSKKLLICNSIFTVPMVFLWIMVLKNHLLSNYGLLMLLLDCIILFYWLYYYCRSVAYFISVKKLRKKQIKI